MFVFVVERIAVGLFPHLLSKWSTFFFPWNNKNFLIVFIHLPSIHLVYSTLVKYCLKSALLTTITTDFQWNVTCSFWAGSRHISQSACRWKNEFRLPLRVVGDALSIRSGGNGGLSSRWSSEVGMRQDAFNVDLRCMMPYVANAWPCARGCHMIRLPDWVETWKMTYMHFSFCSANGWKMPPTLASPSPKPFAKTFVIISYVLKEQISHLRFMSSFHLAPVNDRGHGLSWVIIFSVVALLLKKVFIK